MDAEDPGFANGDLANWRRTIDRRWGGGSREVWHVRLTSVGENLLESLILKLGIVPTPIMDTFIALALARTVMAATRAGVFEALAAGPLSPEEVAQRCRIDTRAAGKLLYALASCRYLRVVSSGRPSAQPERSGTSSVHGDRYSLAPIARKWLLRARPRSMVDAVLHRYLDIVLMSHVEEYLSTGRPVAFHEPGFLTAEQWELYERGQRAGAIYSAPEIARRTPVPSNPRAMLDIGGGHGYYSVALCRRHPSLSSTILDLPAAVEQSRPILAAEGMSDRVKHRAGNALTDDLGIEMWDLVFMANLVHHFDAGTNRDLMRQVARALRPGGTCVIAELIRAPRPEEAGQIGGLTGLYFAITSAGGTCSYEEMAAWQRDAGLKPMKPIRLRMSPGYGLQASRKG